ncbi:MAG: hypothetical protein ACT6T0_08555 [Nevskia sp.]
MISPLAMRIAAPCSLPVNAGMPSAHVFGCRSAVAVPVMPGNMQCCLALRHQPNA